MKADITTLSGETAGSVELADAIFGLEPRADLLHRMVTYQRAKRRAGTHKTLTRAEIARTKKKMYRQKGTGGARHGAMSAGIFRGGGKAHGRIPRDYAHDLPKKVRRLALKHALAAKHGAGELVILDEARLDEPKTKLLREAFGKLGWTDVLIVGGGELDRNFSLAAQNLPQVQVVPAVGINVYDILHRSKLVLTKAALEDLEARLK
ncbi:MAG: 50S ribosomal protein L4 [Pseudomonadota bacterium]